MDRDARTLRIVEVLKRRLGHVRCAIEAVHHRHNISAILRTCDSVGLHHVHLVAGRFHPSKGAARGAERWLDVHQHTSAAEAITALTEAGFAIWIADLADEGLPPEEVPLDRPVCVWMGAELEGVSEAAKRAATGVITIPMRGFAQSLNVSVAAAVNLHPIAERARALGPSALLPEAERESVLLRWMAREEKILDAMQARTLLDLPEP